MYMTSRKEAKAMQKNEFFDHLKNDLIPFWNKLIDRENGGFYGAADSRGIPDKSAVKGCILNSRILWFYSSAYMALNEPELLDYARHAYDFLNEHCFDTRFGGVLWSVNADGSPFDVQKHTYNQAFAIYALSCYYRASGEKSALNTAYELYRMIESVCRDGNGYLEAFTRDLKPDSDNEKLSENGVMAERTMNTLLHVLEAYTELYRADGFERVAESLREILDIFKSRVYNPDKKILEVFFDLDYRPLIDLESFGHDIEASWLIARACEVLDDEKLTGQMQPIIDGLAESALENGYDFESGSMNNECERGIVDRQRIWWVQAETVIGLYNAYQKHPEKREYLEFSEKTWEFIKSRVIDKNTGEWIESIPEQGSPDPEQQLVRLWKCPYHNGRMCMEMMNRL